MNADGMIGRALAFSLICLLGIHPARAQSVVTFAAKPPMAAAVEPLAWDALMKEASPALGDAFANFTFHATNISDHEVVIEALIPSCGCTTAKLPSQPWHLAPQTNGEINISVNLAAKTGTFQKTVTVRSPNLPGGQKVLTVVVHVPDAKAARAGAMAVATTDRQAVFKGECAKCHADPAKGKMAKDLYWSACAVCHESPQRAEMVPDLHKLNHPTDYGYWKMMVSIGKPGTLMPAFGPAGGGPLTDAQVESLARTLDSIFPSHGPTTAGPANTLPSASRGH